MTLQNLLRIGKLKAHAPTAAEVQRLLAAIERNLADAGATHISDGHNTRLLEAGARFIAADAKALTGLLQTLGAI